MSSILKQNFSLSHIKAAMNAILAERTYKNEKNDNESDLKSVLGNFGNSIWKQSSHHSIIEMKEMSEQSFTGENSILQALQIDQKVLRNDLIQTKKEVEYLRQQLEEERERNSNLVQIIKQLKKSIIKLSEAYEEAKSIYHEELSHIAEKQMTENNSTDTNEAQLQKYQLSYLLAAAERNVFNVEVKLRTTEDELELKIGDVKRLEGGLIIHSNEVLMLKEKVKLLEASNLHKKEKIEQLLNKLGQ